MQKRIHTLLLISLLTCLVGCGGSSNPAESHVADAGSDTDFADSRTALADAGADLADSRTTLADAVSNVVDSNVVDANVVDARTAPADAGADLAGAPSDLADAPLNLADTASDLASSRADLADTNSYVVDARTALVDTGSNVVDSASDIADTGSNVVDSAPDIADTGPDVVDSAPDIASTGSVVVTYPTIPDPAITHFSFEAAHNGGLHDSVEGKIIDALITVSVPYWVDVTALVATFVTAGNSEVSVQTNIQESGVTPNDFTNDVTYVVTVADGRSASFVVSVSKATFLPKQVSIIQASDKAAEDKFTRVSLHGDTAVVVAPGADSPDGNIANCGAAYVMSRGTSGAWSESQIAFSSNPKKDGHFGFSYAAGDDTVIVGDNFDNTEQGAAYIVYKEAGGSWTTQRLTQADGFDYMEFGQSVAIDGEYAFVGAPWAGKSNYLDNPGAVYIYKKDSTGWSQDQVLKASDGVGTDPYDQFGYALAASSGRIIVGANWKTVDSKAEAGAAYIYEHNSTTGTWDEKELHASDPQPNDWFGHRVAISGNYAVVGAINSDNSGGALYIFERGPSGDWTQVKILHRSDLGMDVDGRTTDDFALDGDILVIGDSTYDGEGLSGYDGGDLSNSGRVLVYQRNLDGDGAWKKSKELLPSDQGDLHYFGISVSIWRGTVFVGVNKTGNDDPFLAGAVYVFN